MSSVHLCQYTTTEWSSRMKKTASKGDLSEYDASKKCTRKFLGQNYKDNSSCDQHASLTKTRVHITLREAVECKAFSFVCYDFIPSDLRIKFDKKAIIVSLSSMTVGGKNGGVVILLVDGATQNKM